MNTEFNESIYNLIPRTPPPQRQPLKYKSVFYDAVREAAKDKKFSSRTMGVIKTKVETTDYLKKQQKASPTKDTPFQRSMAASEKKSRVPKANVRPTMGSKSNKDFVKTNALTVIKSPAKQPKPRYVDSPGGNSYDLENSGYALKYSSKGNYGKVPQYINTRKEQIKESQRAYDEYVQERFRRGAIQQVSPEELHDTIRQLKQNWEEVYQRYQSLPVLTDTYPGKLRKERMELEMKQLEDDISVLEKHSVVYVTDRY